MFSQDRKPGAFPDAKAIRNAGCAHTVLRRVDIDIDHGLTTKMSATTPDSNNMQHAKGKILRANGRCMLPTIRKKNKEEKKKEKKKKKKKKRNKENTKKNNTKKNDEQRVKLLRQNTTCDLPTYLPSCAQQPAPAGQRATVDREAECPCDRFLRAPLLV